jgi:hypothetical protein
MKYIPKSEASPFLTGSPKIPAGNYHNIRLNFAVAEHARSTSYKQHGHDFMESFWISIGEAISP